MSPGLRETILNNPTPGASPNGAGKSPSAAAAGAQAGMAGAARPRSPPRPGAREARQPRFARSFAQVVAVLMRDPNFRTMPLADLEWLVLPAVAAGQFRLAEAPACSVRQGMPAEGKPADKPGRAARWCRRPWRCGRACRARSTRRWPAAWTRRCGSSPGQWASGDIVWLMAVAGHRRAVPKLI